MSQQECNQARANARRQAERDSASGREVVRDEHDCRLVTVERTVGLNGPYPQIERRQERVCEDPMVDTALGHVPLSDVKQDPWLANGNAGMAYMAQAGMFQNGMMPMMGMYGMPMNAHSMSAMMANANSSARLLQEENASLRLELEANKRVNAELAELALLEQKRQ